MSEATRLLKQEISKLLDKEVEYIDKYETNFENKLKSFAKSEEELDISVDAHNNNISFRVYVKNNYSVSIYGFIKAGMVKTMSVSLGRQCDTIEEQDLQKEMCSICYNFWKHCKEIEELSKTFKNPYIDKRYELQFECSRLEAQEQEEARKQKIAEGKQNLASHKYFYVVREGVMRGRYVKKWYRFVKSTDKSIIAISMWYDIEKSELKDCDFGKKIIPINDFLKELENTHFVDGYVKDEE